MKNDRFQDHIYLEGYMDALSRFSKELDTYKEYAFDSDAFSDQELDGVMRMEADLQQWLSDEIDKVDDMTKNERDN